MNKIMYYSIKDKHIDTFTQPFSAISDDEAKRLVSDAAEVGSQLAKFPSDYILVHVGTFDSSTGFIPTDKRFICSMSDIIRAEVINRTRIIAHLDESEVI